MSITTLKAGLAGLLLRSAAAITPLRPSRPPIITPSAASAPLDPTERERAYTRIAFSAVAWMAYASAEERVAAASLLKRHYPSIGEQIAHAHHSAVSFTEQLRELIRAEHAADEAFTAAQAGKEGVACSI